MSVVVDAGPLLALSKLGLLWILPRLYDPILIPSAVHEEVVLQGIARGYPDALVIQQAILRAELTLIAVSDEELLESIQNLPLGRGEKHVLHLGLAKSSRWVLLDDQRAREEAAHLGLHVKGTIGVIVQAYRQEIIGLKEVEFAFQTIIDRPDIWIAAAFVRRIWDILESEERP